MSATLRGIYRKPVFSAKGKRYGRVREALFHPEKPVVVGYIVERPRLLYLFDRADRHLALDATDLRDGELHITSPKDAFDKQAASRLGIDWDVSVVWAEMPARTESGKIIGRVHDGRFDPTSGRLLAVEIGGTAADNLAIGTRALDGSYARGYQDGFVVIADAILEAQRSGGAADAAGRGAAIAKDRVTKAAYTATVYGKAAAKVARDSEAGKKAGRWLRSLKDTVVDAMGDPDEE